MTRTLVVPLACVCLGACATSKPAAEAEAVSPVTAETRKIEERDQTIGSFKAALAVALKNASASEVAATRAHWEVVIGGKVVGSGESALSQAIPANGEATAEIVVPVEYARSDEEIAALVGRKEPIEYAVRGTIDAGGKVEFARAGAVRAPRMPILKLASLDTSTSASVGVAVSAQIDLDNPNTFPLVLVSARWKLTLGGKVAGEGVFDRKAPKAASHTSYPIEITIEPPEVKARKELQGATVPYQLEAELDLGAAKVRLDQAGDSKLLRAGD